MNERKIPQVNLAMFFFFGLAEHIASVIRKKDDSVMRIALSQPIKKQESMLLVVSPSMFPAFFSFEYQGGFTQDWQATLMVQDTKGLDTPRDLLELMWLSGALDIDGMGKAVYLGYLVTEHHTKMEDNCFPCFHNSKPKIYKYSELKKKGEVDEKCT